METKEYTEFIKWAKEQKEFKTFTRTQWTFIEFLLQHKEEVNKIGDLTSPFLLIIKYFRS